MKNFQQTPRQRNRQERIALEKDKKRMAHRNPLITFSQESRLRNWWGHVCLTNHIYRIGGRL